MNNKRRASRTIVYKYVEVPQAQSATPLVEPTSQFPKDALAYRAWANCYQPPTVHFDVPTATSSTSSSTFTTRSDSTSSLHSAASSTSSYGAISKLSSLKQTSPLLVRPPSQTLKTRAYSSPATLTKPTRARPELTPGISPSPSKPWGRSVETSYMTLSTTITTKDGAVVKARKIVSSHGYHSSNTSADWNLFRRPD